MERTMGCRSAFFKTIKFGANALSYAVVSAVSGAASGAVGAAVLRATGNDNFVPLEAAKIGALGGFFLGGLSGAFSYGFTNSESEEPGATSKSLYIQAVMSVMLLLLVGGAGDSLLKGDKTMGYLLSEFGIGTAILGIPTLIMMLRFYHPAMLSFNSCLAKRSEGYNVSPVNEAHESKVATDDVEMAEVARPSV
jgi:hypothetical protein